MSRMLRVNATPLGFGWVTVAGASAFGALAVSAHAQAPVVSRPVVQSLPGGESLSLNAALARLARDPRDVGALIDAGNAALTMGDVDAATGFFRRADQVAPGNPRVKAGLAGARVRNGDPFGAIPLFEEAARAGAIDASLLGDQGLAYDLVGDNATAQRYYRQALARGADDEVTRRLSLSLAIAGDKQGAELALSPLLQRRDQAAWRTRAFTLAILGQTEEAVSIANTVLPGELAEGIAPYLRYMPRLTRAQQAAAANFGAFPRASEIGRDDPRVAAYVRSPATGARTASADTAVAPRGASPTRESRSRTRRKDVRAVRVAPPEPQPARQSDEQPIATRAALASPTPPPRAAPQPPSPQPPSPQPPSPQSPSPAPAARSSVVPGFASPLPVAATPAPRPAEPSAPPAPGPSVAVAASPSAASVMGPPASDPVTRAPVTTPAAPTPAPARITLADAFREFARPTIDATPAAGAVDIRRIAPARTAKPAPLKAAPPKPAPPSHPSRIWVQVATGRDKSALNYDWRRMARQSAEVFGGKQPFVSAWGQTNRLLTGPFQTEAAANAYIAQLGRAGINGPFVWTSPAGQVVDAIAAAEPAPARQPQARSQRQQPTKKKR